MHVKPFNYKYSLNYYSSDKLDTSAVRMAFEGVAATSHHWNRYELWPRACAARTPRKPSVWLCLQNLKTKPQHSLWCDYHCHRFSGVNLPMVASVEHKFLHWLPCELCNPCNQSETKESVAPMNKRSNGDWAQSTLKQTSESMLTFTGVVRELLREIAIQSNYLKLRGVSWSPGLCGLTMVWDKTIDCLWMSIICNFPSLPQVTTCRNNIAALTKNALCMVFSFLNNAKMKFGFTCQSVLYG